MSIGKTALERKLDKAYEELISQRNLEMANNISNMRV